MGGAASREPGSPRAVAVIPARLASTRLARKMLLAETGQALVVHTALNAARCSTQTQREFVRGAGRTGLGAGVHATLHGRLHAPRDRSLGEMPFQVLPQKDTTPVKS